MWVIKNKSRERIIELDSIMSVKLQINVGVNANIISVSWLNKPISITIRNCIAVQKSSVDFECTV